MGHIQPYRSLSSSRRLVSEPEFCSFPSNRAATSFTVIKITLVHYGIVAFVPVLVLTVLVTFSEVCLHIRCLASIVTNVVLNLAYKVYSILVFGAMIPV